MTDNIVICEKFKPRPKQLWPGKQYGDYGPCQYHRGGTICTRRDVFCCESQGQAAWPWRADSDDDGEE